MSVSCLFSFVACLLTAFAWAFRAARASGRAGGGAQVKHGISSQYIYRGLYAAQLQRCFRHVPRDRVLVLDSARLRTDPGAALRAVHTHLGLADYAYPGILRGGGGGGGGGTAAASADSAALSTAFEAWYPSFEGRTGWRMEGAYGELPAEVRRELAAFYAPANALLARMLGQDFSFAP